MTPIQTSLTAKLLWLISLLSLFLVLVTSAMEVAEDRSELIETEQREARAAVIANSAALSLSLWSLDQRALVISANSLITGSSIFRVEILEGSETRVAAHRNGAMLKADYSWEEPLFRPGTRQKIGTLRISENYENVLKGLRARALYLIGVEIAKVMTLSALLFFIIHRWLTRPLSRLAAQVGNKVALESSASITINRPQIGGYDEIDALVDAVNSTNRERRRIDAEQRLLQAREVQSSKNQALGQMAGGVAHDFNNILGAILGFARLLSDDVPRQSLQQHFVQRILGACERGKILVEQVLTFARGGGLEKRRLDLRHVVRSCENILAASFGRNTKTRFNYADKELPILGSEARLGQLVSNLCLNADEALRGKPGSVTVDMGRITHDSMEHVKATGADERLSGVADRSRDYVYLRVTDSGEGIAASDLDRIFEPFFTTKGRQRGTGLGLPVVHSVVEGHDGLVHVKSTPGAGTVFSIYLPMSTDEAEVSLPSGILPENVLGHERIMVVDDNEDIADALVLGLTRLGYDAVAVNDPLEAIEAFSEDPMAFDAVITDQVMPQLRGLHLIAKLKAIRPDIKVLLCTGYSDNISESVALAAGASCFHIKPVDAASLAVSLRRLLDVPH